MKKTKTIIHEFRKSRPAAWLAAQKRKKARWNQFPAICLDKTNSFTPLPLGVCIGVFVVAALTIASCSSHHYFSINAEEITNPSIMYSDSTALQNPF